VKIKGTCKRDGRDFMAEQVIDAGGRCPWDGEPFNADYAVTLVNALRDAEEAGTRLEQALEQVASLNPAFTLHPQSVLGSVRSSLERIGQNLIRQG
jgi:hypothetical protein